MNLFVNINFFCYNVRKWYNLHFCISLSAFLGIVMSELSEIYPCLSCCVLANTDYHDLLKDSNWNELLARLMKSDFTTKTQTLVSNFF